MSTSRRIPKVIHYCWFGGGKLGERDKACIESWIKYCPDYEIKRWDESNYDIEKNRYMHDAYLSQKWGFVPDYARLDIIYTEGGIYLDTDVELLTTLDPFLNNQLFCGFETDARVNFGQGFGAVAGHPLLEEMMRAYDSARFVLKDGSLNLTPSPFYQTSVLVDNGLKPIGEFQDLGFASIYPKEVFCPKSFETGELNITKNTVSIHHFAMSWVDPSVVAERRYREWLIRHRVPLKLASALSKGAGIARHHDFKRLAARLFKTIHREESR